VLKTSHPHGWHLSIELKLLALGQFERKWVWRFVSVICSQVQQAVSVEVYRRVLQVRRGAMGCINPGVFDSLDV
jgi:hypothetical protein